MMHLNQCQSSYQSNHSRQDLEYQGQRYDVGNKFGYVKTNIEYGLTHPEVKDELKDYIVDLAKRLQAEDKPSANNKKTTK